MFCIYNNVSKWRYIWLQRRQENTFGKLQKKENSHQNQFGEDSGEQNGLIFWHCSSGLWKEIIVFINVILNEQPPFLFQIFEDVCSKVKIDGNLRKLWCGFGSKLSNLFCQFQHKVKTNQTQSSIWRKCHYHKHLGNFGVHQMFHTNSIDVSDKFQNVWSPTQAKKFGAQTIIGVQREIGSLLKLSPFYVKISLRGDKVQNKNL